MAGPFTAFVFGDPAPQPATLSPRPVLIGPQFIAVVAGPPPVPVDETLPNAIISVPYSQTFAVSGGVGPFTFSVPSGSPPTGITLSSVGVLSGTATALGSSTFTVKVVDSTGANGSIPFTLAVVAAAGGNSGFVG
jgi:hypothetical protein